MPIFEPGDHAVVKLQGSDGFSCLNNLIGAENAFNVGDQAHAGTGIFLA